MSKSTRTPAAWKPICHRGRFEMHALTRAFFQEEHGVLMSTRFAAELRCDDGTATLLQFTSAASMAGFVSEMAPVLIEIHHATGEDVTELSTALQAAWNDVRGRAKEIAEAVIARAARTTP